MKIVGFTTDQGLRLGLIEGDQVVDLQAVDPSVPNDLAAVLRQHNGDLKPLAEIAERATVSAKRPLAVLDYALPVARPGKIICLASTISSTSRKAAMPITCRNFRRCSRAASIRWWRTSIR